MATPESKVKKFIDDKMKKWFPEAIRDCPGGGMFHKSGMPDRMWYIEAVPKQVMIVVCIEAKRAPSEDDPEGGNATDLQMATLRKFAKRGAICALVTGNDLSHMERIRDEINRRIALARTLFNIS